MSDQKILPIFAGLVREINALAQQQNILVSNIHVHWHTSTVDGKPVFQVKWLDANVQNLVEPALLQPEEMRPH